MTTTYTEGRPLPPPSEWVARIFIRAEGFYSVALPADDDLNEHARCNPGTLRIEDLDGNVLWPEGSKQ